MATYVIGDIQGCYTELQRLLKLIEFNPAQDVLWCTGDLVNRGSQSLEVLRFIKQLAERAIVVLGNHDLHLLAVAYGNDKYLHHQDTLLPVLQAPDGEILIDWLRHRPLLHHDTQLGFTLIHAGLPPQWDLAQASRYAGEVEEVLHGLQYQAYFTYLYGDKPNQWSADLTGWDRLRFITNCFTRLRYCNAEGQLALQEKGAPQWGMDNEVTTQPWFWWSHRASREMRIVFGHWASLGYYAHNGVYALDTGCVWGGALTAMRLEDEQIFRVPCPGACAPSKV